MKRICQNTWIIRLCGMIIGLLRPLRPMKKAMHPMLLSINIITTRLSVMDIRLRPLWKSRKRKKMRKEKLQIRTKLMKQRKKTEDLQVAGWNVLMRATKLHLQVPMRESTFIG